MRRRIFIPEAIVKIESQNQTHYAHWSKAHKYKTRWFVAIRAHLPPLARGPGEKRRLSILSIRSRLLDVSNLWGGIKPIPDALVALKWLEDDSPEWVETMVHQHKWNPDPRGTEIIIESIDPKENRA